MIKANDFRSSIRRHGTSNRKFSHSNHFVLQKNSPACTTDAVLRKYGDTSARCTSFGPYCNNGNQNPFYIELAQAENYYGERRWDLQGGRMPLILLKSLNWPHPAKNFKRGKTFDKRGKTFDNSKFNFRSIM